MAVEAKSAPAAPVMPMTRREFLYYIWAASLALFTAQTGGALLWFALPRYREGEFGGTFTIDVADIPAPDSGPKSYDDGRFWLVNLGDKDVSDERLPRHPDGSLVYPQIKGVKALYKICVHLGCLYKWVPTNNRFECPCHGSKYLTTGVRVDGPARRNLDVFQVTAYDANGNVIAETEVVSEANPDGKAIDVTGAVKIVVDTGKPRVNGDFNAAPGGGK
jgi:cytochrome b6-f complex iron-sulfur subunit